MPPVMCVVPAPTGQSIDLAELLVWNATLTTAQCDDVRAYLNSKWGLSMPQPATLVASTLPADPAADVRVALWLDGAGAQTTATARAPDAPLQWDPMAGTAVTFTAPANTGWRLGTQNGNTTVALKDGATVSSSGSRLFVWLLLSAQRAVFHGWACRPRSSPSLRWSVRTPW